MALIMGCLVTEKGKKGGHFSILGRNKCEKIKEERRKRPVDYKQRLDSTLV